MSALFPDDGGFVTAAGCFAASAPALAGVAAPAPTGVAGAGSPTASGSPAGSVLTSLASLGSLASLASFGSFGSAGDRSFGDLSLGPLPRELCCAPVGAGWPPTPT
jgi:hypothetical protein